MFPALIKIRSVFTFCTIFFCFCAGKFSANAVLAQDAAGFTSIRYAVVHSPKSLVDDPIEFELDQIGHHGQLIAIARSSVLSILSDDNVCSAWYRQTVPDAVGIFRSLHFVVDGNGQSEILRRENSSGNLEYLHPYVAHARQDEGSGSAITLNENGAFFKDYARVFYSSAPPNVYTSQFTRPLVVGDFSGDTAQARTLTLLHEFAHVVGLLPLDSGSASAAFRSVQNTKTVLKNCKPQIEREARRPSAALRTLLAGVPAPRQPSSGFFAMMPRHSAIPPRQ